MLERLKFAIQPRYAGGLTIHKTKGGYADETPFLELKEKTGLFGLFGRRLLYIRIPEEGWSGDNIQVTLQDRTVLQDVEDVFARTWPAAETSIEIR